MMPWMSDEHVILFQNFFSLSIYKYSEFHITPLGTCYHNMIMFKENWGLDLLMMLSLTNIIW